MEPIVKYLELGLDGAAQKQEALSNNIANINTPNYKRKDVNFKDVLKKHIRSEDRQLSLDTTAREHISSLHSSFDGLNSTRFKISSRQSTSYKNDGNSVDIDTEMAELAKNDIYYNTLVQQLNKRFSMLKNVISKGSSS